MHIGAFFDVSNGAFNIICDCFDLLLHLCMKFGLFLLLYLDQFRIQHLLGYTYCNILLACSSCCVVPHAELLRADFYWTFNELPWSITARTVA